MKLLISIILLVLTIRCNANINFSILINGNNVHCIYETGGKSFREIENKLSIVTRLTDKLSKANKYTGKIFIHFANRFSLEDTSYFDIGFENYKSFDDVIEKGLVIRVKGRDVDITKLITSIAFALNNIEFIKQNQYQQVVKPQYSEPDTFMSISSKTLQQSSNFKSKILDNVLSSKYYRYSERTLTKNQVDYYYQNRKFYFYNTNDVEENFNEKTKEYEITKYSNKVYFSLDNVYEIVGSVDDEFLVFNTDSSFYYVPERQDTVIGIYTLHTINGYRNSIHKYLKQQKPYKAFYLFIDDYKPYRKVAFIPDSNLVIENYDSLENNLIKSYKISQIKPLAKLSEKNNSKLYILMLLCFVTIGIYISIRRK